MSISKFQRMDTRGRFNGNCKFGFIATTANEGRTVSCKVCTQSQTIERRVYPEDDDEGLQKMLAEGTMKRCPRCALLTMKEYGVCNVIDYEQCRIWWNWATMETGRDSKVLKSRSRQLGTLWGPGELAFQQNLKRTNPAAFRALLERNGVEYNPNYIRGTG